VTYEARSAIDIILGRPAWQADAACRGQGPDAWFASGGTSRITRETCAGCVVQPECLKFAVTALDQPHGIWGGMSARQIRRIRLRRSSTP
jgi:WhiB family transcriptional regulator, redox-sensing transcriptional regulator